MTETTQAPAPPAVGDLGQALGALLRRYHEGATEAVSELPGGPRGFDVLRTSSLGSCSNQATMAQLLGIDRTVMTYLVDDLEHAGLVMRRPDPADRRARQVLLTDKGRDVLATATEDIRAVEASVLAGLSDDDAQLLRRLVISASAGAPPLDHSQCEAAAQC
ncbi:MarR family winged helix-turn-helix transcriptional regulator [Aeromicrobium wangtongii]|uniref:MarR family winged helix-turn-helix transcriptional regulator n=1 Tax=Aeromicrobium wangtongii TaxID=2969247 RepID=UPI0020181F82|nr:MarR family winged helix-turn-helix transcriptional regulator [Aeromicrobium wangtongii]MCL3817149.1 MarR family winged helix-turn-helix transcriptional regulator [Aeromicrobium wangtongii]